MAITLITIHPRLVGYNEYVECIGKHIGAGACANVKRDGVIFHLTQDTKLVHMLSVDKETSGNDDEDHGWLLLVIMDIVSLMKSN